VIEIRPFLWTVAAFAMALMERYLYRRMLDRYKNQLIIKWRLGNIALAAVGRIIFKSEPMILEKPFIPFELAQSPLYARKSALRHAISSSSRQRSRRQTISRYDPGTPFRGRAAGAPGFMKIKSYWL
jgi:hypothetical protein